MTTDPTPLQERIARALYENAEYYGPEPTRPPWDWRDDEGRGEWMEIAAAVLPIIAAEVRKAKAEALRSAARDIEASDRHLPGMAVRDVYRGLRFRADDMETGGQA